MKATILSLFLALTSPMLALSQNAQPQTQPPTLIVNGTAELKVAPDRAILRLGVVRQGPTALNAQDVANRTGQEILSSLNKIGITSDRIQTSRITLSPIYGERRPGSNDPPRVVAYNATNTISVTVEDLTKVGPAIDAGLTAGANQLEGVQFDLKNDLSARQQALRQAVTEARTKAATMADALDVQLVSVQEVSEGGVAVIPRFAEVGGIMAAKAAEIAPTPVSPGEIDVNANVTIRYRIAPK